MVLPPGHYREIAARRQFTRREKTIAGSVAGGLAIVAVAFSLIGPSEGTAPGCVRVSILGATGAATLHACGADARALCRAANKPGGYGGDAGREIAAACRKVGLPLS